MIRSIDTPAERSRIAREIPEYDCTNRFYRSLGFRELECLPQLWDAWNPCQIYIRTIERRENET